MMWSCHPPTHTHTHTPTPGDARPQVALLRNYTNGLTALVANLKAQKSLGRQVRAARPAEGRDPAIW